MQQDRDRSGQDKEKQRTDSHQTGSLPQTVSLMDQATTFRVLQESVLGLWDVVNLLTTIQPPKHERYRVSIFGSARVDAADPIYAGVGHLASELTRLGCDIVTGGGPGLMQAANEGSVLADPEDRTTSIGIRVNLDFEQGENPFVEQVYQHRTFFTRLHHFVLISDAFVVVPGGIGTTLEALMIWQLLQVRKLDSPLIMVGSMWADLVQWTKLHMLAASPPLAQPEDLNIPHCVADFDQAIDLIRQAHRLWQGPR